jgi:hypothetical protein
MISPLTTYVYAFPGLSHQPKKRNQVFFLLCLSFCLSLLLEYRYHVCVHACMQMYMYLYMYVKIMYVYRCVQMILHFFHHFSAWIFMRVKLLLNWLNESQPRVSGSKSDSLKALGVSIVTLSPLISSSLIDSFKLCPMCYHWLPVLPGLRTTRY